MTRITYKKVKEWLKESIFAQEHIMTLHSWNGYYYILDARNNTVVSAKTPGEVWERFNLLKTGYYMGLEEGKKCKE